MLAFNGSEISLSSKVVKAHANILNKATLQVGGGRERYRGAYRWC